MGFETRINYPPGALSCEFLPETLGVETQAPGFSWKLHSPEEVRGNKHTAWHIFVASDRATLDRKEGDLWDSGKIDSDQSALIRYRGKMLLSSSPMGLGG